ncbi:hypothetical protein [Streptosporangium subroseum]|uniref:hypothetical protein n=1 Tax=Streptosporangium subroseum TaxID=106412 RepID=UPI003084976F|nr:hypothetical protein OHB15_17480 [Streptosporangium subroseum]
MIRYISPRAKILAALLVVLAASLFVCNVMKNSATARIGANDRLKLVILNGFAVANPDYQVDFLQMKSAGLIDQRITRVGSEMEIPVILEARSNQSFSWGKWIQAEITVERSGRIDTPRLGVWELTKLLTGANGILGKFDSANLGNLSSLQSLQVVIWLQSPINENELLGILPKAAHLDMVLLSPGSNDRKPIGWDAQEDCTLRGMGICRSDRTLTGQFKRWVSLLTKNDEQTLNWLGLDLRELRSRAMEGKIYGAVLTLPPADSIEIQLQPIIAWTRIVDAQL